MHDHVHCRKPLPPHDLAVVLVHAPAEPVARDRAAHPPTSGESQSRVACVVAAHVEHGELAVQPPPPAVDPPVVTTRPYPPGPLLEAAGASGVPRSVQRQTVSRLRPLRRRRDRIARPCLVLIRRRKPCFFLRRRLFGWYVLFTFLPSPRALGGEGGIRTHGPRKRSTVFETAPFDHSGTSPRCGQPGAHRPPPPWSWRRGWDSNPR